MLRYVCELTFCLPSVRSALRALKDLSFLPPSFLPVFIFSLFPCFCSHHQLSTYCVSGTVLSLEGHGDRKINSASGDCGGLECTEFTTRCIRLWDALLQMAKTEPDSVALSKLNPKPELRTQRNLSAVWRRGLSWQSKQAACRSRTENSLPKCRPEPFLRCGSYFFLLFPGFASLFQNPKGSSFTVSSFCFLSPLCWLWIKLFIVALWQFLPCFANHFKK